MLITIAKRFGELVLLVILVNLGFMLLLDRVPENAATVSLGPGATEEQIRTYEEELGLDRPFMTRYVDWMGDLVTGDWGRSPASGQTVAKSIGQALPVTLELALLAMLFALLLAIPTAVYAGYRRGGVADRAALLSASALTSAPAFLIALLLILVFALHLRWLPSLGWVPLDEDPLENLRHVALPAIALSSPLFAIFVRVLRNDMVTTLGEDYITAARARGLTARRVLFRHALRPSLVSLLTVVGVMLGTLLGGAVLIESIFSLPGIGTLSLNAVNARDFNTLRAIVVLIAVFYAVTNAIIDVAYTWLDPRAHH